MAGKYKSQKTLAMHVLEREHTDYQVVKFPDTIHDAIGVANYAGLPPHMVYKTLVVEAAKAGSKPMLVMIASHRELDLKRVAAAVGVRKVTMARQSDAERLTDLRVGGISALALLNRGFAIYIDRHAEDLEEIVVSAGQRGINLRLPVPELIRITGAMVIEASRE
jgi:Cys-tRNA(Pro)/Cys-tRNA(Cys) deacylase